MPAERDPQATPSRERSRFHPELSVSVVSHGQGALVERLLGDIEEHVRVPVEVILTLNVQEHLPFDACQFQFPLILIENAAPKGFGANHNDAFRAARGDCFCVANPDIHLQADPFPPLIAAAAHSDIGVVAPFIVAPDGQVEDSVRRFPTPMLIFKKALGIAPWLDYPIGDLPTDPDWVAGMFMLFPADAFRRLGGFDESYFLYYEDVDLCARARQLGYRVRLVPEASVIHTARRASRRSIRHLRWHAVSMLRFFLTRYD